MENVFKKVKGDVNLADIKIGKPITPMERNPIGLSFISKEHNDMLTDLAKSAYSSGDGL